MKFTDLVEIIWNNMRRRMGRTILTTTGVIIGSIAIFVIVSLGNGYQNMLVDQLNSLGDANSIAIYPYTDSTAQSQGITNVDDKKRKAVLNDKVIKELKKQSFVKYCTPIMLTSGTLQFKKIKKDGITVQGMEFKDYEEDHKLLFGSFPSDTREECILSYQQAQQLINNDDFMSVTDESLKTLLRKKITITENITNDDGTVDTKEFNLKITGIQNQNLQGGASIICNLNTVNNINQYLSGKAYNAKANGYQELELVIKGSNSINAAEQYLRDNGFMFFSIKEIQNQVSNILGVVKLVLGALGGISLFVAAFGIANTMNMAIYERKKEIGVMKVVGASLKDVKKIFIGEASAIGFSGGVIGIGIGLLINFMINISMKSRLSEAGAGADQNLASVSLGLIIFVLAFATFIGFLSGLYPASRAAKLNVINSIKDE